MEVKMRRVGTTTVLPVPQGIEPTSNTYPVVAAPDGAIAYLPKKRNPFKNPAFVASHLDDGDDTGFVRVALLDSEPGD